MRKFLFVVSAFVLSQTSCKKDSTGSTPDLTTYLKFTANGKVYELATPTIYKESDPIYSSSYFLKTESVGSATKIIFNLQSSTFTTGSYNPGASSYCTIQLGDYTGVDYNVLSSADAMGVTVTKYENGFADGTFAGRLTKFGNNNTAPQTIQVTNGEFKHVKVIQ